MNPEKHRYARFLLLWAADMVSAIGSGMTSFGLGVYIFARTGSASDMALVTLAGFLPTLLLSVPAGVLADRYDRRLLIMIGDGFSALGILYILLCMENGDASLTAICTGVFVSAFFSALLEPAYRATVTDLLSPQQYSKAGGLVSLASSVRYLVSPLLAGALLAVSDIRILLVMDICTFFPTVAAAALIRRNMRCPAAEGSASFLSSLNAGWQAVSSCHGLLVLIMASSLLTCFMGCFQVLAQPLILDFADTAVLGFGETVCACGMLVSGLWLGMRGLKGGYVRILAAGLFLAGLFMVGFGLREDLVLICVCGFLFFMTLPFVNNCLECLVRILIPDDLQGRAWGLIGFLSQIGYVAAYGVAGRAADGLADFFHISVGRGSALVIILSGIFLSLTALAIAACRPVRRLEQVRA